QREQPCGRSAGTASELPAKLRWRERAGIAPVQPLHSRTVGARLPRKQAQGRDVSVLSPGSGDVAKGPPGVLDSPAKLDVRACAKALLEPTHRLEGIALDQQVARDPGGIGPSLPSFDVVLLAQLAPGPCVCGNHAGLVGPGAHGASHDAAAFADGLVKVASEDVGARSAVGIEEEEPRIPGCIRSFVAGVEG